MVPPPSSHSRSGTFSPAPIHGLQTGLTHSPHPSQGGPLSAGASPSTSSPTTGSSNSLTKIVVAQVYLLLSTINKDKDRAKWELQVDQLNKLLDDHGMEVFSRYFTRLVAGNAAQIFPGLNRPNPNPGNYSLLVSEMDKISHDPSQASKIAESIETANEDIFRDFDLSTFMEHFKLDALEKTILALAFKVTSRSDLKTKADAILSANFPTFVNIISRPDLSDHTDLTPTFIAAIVDRYIQGHPPNFNAAAKHELSHKVQSRWAASEAPPLEVLASLDLIRVLGEKPPNALALYIQKSGPDFTRDEDTCLSYLQNRPTNIQLSEEQVSAALTYTTVSITYRHNPSVLVAALRRNVPPTFNWQDVVAYFDQRDVRVSPEQFLRLYNALLPIAQRKDEQSPPFDIQSLWGGTHWENPETQLAFICAFASLTPNDLDASTIPGSQPTFTLGDYAQSPPEVRERAAFAVKHPLVSGPALLAIFQVALHSLHASQSTEAKRLFQKVVVPNLDIFIVSAFGVPKPWPAMAIDTLVSLFDSFLHRRPHHEFVFDTLWRKDRDWVTQRLVDAHAIKPGELPLIYGHVIKHGWLDDLVYLPNGFGLDLASFAHGEGQLDLTQWARNISEATPPISPALTQFLLIKANLEIQSQKAPAGQLAQNASTPLQLKTVLALLQILEDFLPRDPLPELILVQRACITAYPRLVNYGEGYDDIIDANGKGGHGLPHAAVVKMEEQYKKMYSEESEVKAVVQRLQAYKHSRDPLEQDIFACMIHGLFDEYSHFVGYPLEALATTAVLFGGIISHKLISELPLKIGLGMILEAVRDHRPEDNMYKFGLQALMQLFSRFREWPGFCKQLLKIPGLHGTEAWRKAEEVVREDEEEKARGQNGNGPANQSPGDAHVNGASDASDSHAPPFTAINVDPPPVGAVFEDPSVEAQDKIQFGLNNLTATSLQATFREICAVMDERHQQWFASHLVEERAKMQPNYHEVYLDFVKLFQHRGLWSEVLRQTYISVARMLNAESTMQNSTDRTQLKYLGAWLGLLTLARDQPIKHRNIAFKQLLIEAHDTKRLVVVVPFVCKVLIQAAKSSIFRPPNPWLMDIIHLLIELYHNAELKLNQKFEIEVLCKDLNLDHKSIEPSSELQDRDPIDGVELSVPEIDQFESLSLNGLPGPGAPGLSPPTLPVSLPEIGNMLSIPPTNEMVVNPARLHEMVRSAVTKALHDIVQPVVDRSVTIAAISTQQMIHKDFATEPDENRLRTAAINMVRATAGSLAQVTSKEPLRANITNYLRAAASELPQGLPEGTILMCVNSNLDLACNIIEKQAEDRAIPEIEEMIQDEIEARRRHRLHRPNEPYVDPGLTRWAMAIPHPFKLAPSTTGLNAEQMAIYDDFARQPRGATQTSGAHVSSASDTTRIIANEVLGDQYNPVPSLPTPAETPALPLVGGGQVPYSHMHAGLTNGRPAAHPGQIDPRVIEDKISKLLEELKQTAETSPEQHFGDLPKPHSILDVVDAFSQLIIKTSQNSDGPAVHAAERICNLLFSRYNHNTLFLESLVHILELILKISASSGSNLHDRVQVSLYSQPPQNILHIPLISALLQTDLLDMHNIDVMTAKVLAQREDSSLEFFEQLLDLTLFNDRPLALYADFVHSWVAAWEWITAEPSLEVGQRLKLKCRKLGMPKPQTNEPTEQRELFDYVLEEWTRVLVNSSATDKTLAGFVRQMRSRGLISSLDDFLLFVRRAVDTSVSHFEHTVHTGGTNTEAFATVDALVQMVIMFAKDNEADTDDSRDCLYIFRAVLSLIPVVLNHHHVTRGEGFCQRVFGRLFMMMLHAIDSVFVEHLEPCRKDLLLDLAGTFLRLSPERFPGFAFSWLSLIGHRQFLPSLLMLEGRVGWAPYTRILQSLLGTLSEYVKGFDIPDVVKEFYRGTFKLLVMLAHDYPEFVAANATRICYSIAPHCKQLRNVVLNSSPRTDGGDEVSAQNSQPGAPGGFSSPLRDAGMVEVLNQLLEAGPSEDGIAHLTHAINKRGGNETSFGYVRLGVDPKIIDDIVAYVGSHAVSRFQRDGSVGSVFVQSSADMATLSLLVHELSPEGRYFLLSSIVDRLRNPGPLTEYFSLVVLELFSQDMNDPEELDIRQQIVRVLLERLAGYWPQPWGLMSVILELTKVEKYMFFDQPFIKADRDISEQFMAIARQAP